MSFEDVARRVGIKKPSIVHHFSSKAELGKAVVRRYRQQFQEILGSILTQTGGRADHAISVYFLPFLDLGEDNDLICLCGSLAGEFGALSEDLKQEVTAFFHEHHAWLKEVLALGREQGDLHFVGEPQALAELIFDALQGALMISRATKSDVHIAKVVATLKQDVLGMDQTATA